MLVADVEIIITKTFTAALMLSPFGFYGDILKLVYTKYLGHVIANNMTDDADMMRQRRQLYALGNVKAISCAPLR